MKTPKEKIKKYIIGNSKWNLQTYPAVISSITPKVEVTYSKLPKPDHNLFIEKYGNCWYNYYVEAMKVYEASKVVSEVKNACKFYESNAIVLNPDKVDYEVIPVEIGQPCSIIETGEGKVKIVKI